MRRRSLIALSAIAAYLPVVAVIAGCASTPKRGADEFARAEADEIAAVLDAVERSVEQHDLAGVLRHVWVYYRDAEENDYMKLRMLLATTFRNYGTIEIERKGTSITVQNDRATARERFATQATPRPGTDVPSIDEAGAVVIRLEQVAGDWLITEWLPAAE